MTAEQVEEMLRREEGELKRMLEGKKEENIKIQEQYQEVFNLLQREEENKKVLEEKLKAYVNRIEVFEDKTHNFDYNIQEIVLDKAGV